MGPLSDLIASGLCLQERKQWLGTFFSTSLSLSLPQAATLAEPFLVLCGFVLCTGHDGVPVEVEFVQDMSLVLYIVGT